MQARNGWPVQPYSCPCCTKCWRYMHGPKEGRCLYEGPYLGYIDVEETIQEDAQASPVGQGAANTEATMRDLP